MNALNLLAGPAAQAIGWALLHLLWQATIVAGILAAVLALMSKQSANARYVVSCGALGLVFSMFVATAIRAYDPAVAPVVTTPGSASGTVKLSITEIPVLLAQTAAEGAKDRLVAVLASAREALPAIVAIWLAGVVLLSSRLLVSWFRARRLVHHGAEPAPDHLQLTAIRLSDALGLRTAVKLLQSAAVEVPSVLGTLRPIVLVPASTLTGMTPEQIEMVLAHELAHVRRHDFLVNLLQAVVETLMFYHPAVWWMSRKVRVERENCCDDLAVAVCGNPIQYARALTRLEELRASALPMVVTATGGSLLDRIRRIAAGSDEGTAANARWAAALVMVGILTIAVAVPSLPALAQRDDGNKKKETGTAASSNIDVVETSEPGEAVDVDVDVDVDNDEDIDTGDAAYELDVPDSPERSLALLDMMDDRVAPLPPAPAVPAVPGVAPTPRAMPVPSVRPAIAPRPPIAAVAAMDADFDLDFDFDFDHEFEFGDSDDRPIGASGKLTVDELISLRSVEVTPDYVNAMREVFPDLTLRGVASLKAVGATPEFVRQMRAAGLEVKTAKQASSLAAVGVTPEFVKTMRDAGLPVTNAKEASSLAAVGVTPEFIRNMRSAGLAVTSAKEATTLASVGVTAEFIRQMREAGFAVTSAKEASGLAAVGVTPQWIRDMKAAGVSITTAKDAQSMRAVGVTPDFVRRLAKAGYTNLTARELARMAAAGVDEDFINEMEQYRKKN